MNTGALNKILITDLLKIFESGDTERLNDIVAPDYLHNIETIPPGRAAFKQYVAGLRAAVPDIRMPVLNMVADGDIVAVRNRVRGTHLGDLGPLKASGNRFDITVMHFYRVSEGHAVEHWECLDRTELQKQLTA